MNLLFLLFLFGALVLPVRFHLHLHGRGNTFFFFIEMSLTHWRFLDRTFFLTLEPPKENPENTPGGSGSARARVGTQLEGELPAVPG